jgi:hypothetical protein
VPAAPAAPERPQAERHRAPALWVVVAGIVLATVLAVVDGARPAAVVVGVTLLGAAIARLMRRGRRPEGIAVRSTWWDAVVLGVMASGILLLQSAPGV